MYETKGVYPTLVDCVSWYGALMPNATDTTTLIGKPAHQTTGKEERADEREEKEESRKEERRNAEKMESKREH